jgi:biotin operon repressor
VLNIKYKLWKISMENHLKIYQEAVAEAIKSLHSKGLPAYQSKNGYIVAIYPDGSEVKLQKNPSNSLFDA